MPRSSRLEGLARSLLERAPPRAKSLIVTVYGDAIAPHGGKIWLGSLIELLAGFGLNERAVRTAVHRLVREGWLASRPVGRRSHYSLTPSGQLRFDDAHRRIYAAGADPWSGEWKLVIACADALSAAERERLRIELAWLGFGQLAPTILAHPSADAEALGHVLRDLGLVDRVVILHATSDALSRERALHALVGAAWDLDALARAYREFLEMFRPILRGLEAAQELEPAACFLVRILLVHAYRRILLRDPQLPDELLPGDWAGRSARALCRDIYRRAAEPAERHLMAAAGTDVALPRAEAYFYERFGGLEPGATQKESAAA